MGSCSWQVSAAQQEGAESGSSRAPPVVPPPPKEWSSASPASRTPKISPKGPQELRFPFFSQALGRSPWTPSPLTTSEKISLEESQDSCRSEDQKDFEGLIPFLLQGNHHPCVG